VRVVAESQNQKIDELVGKVKALGQRVKSTRDGFGSPLVDRALERLNRISAKLPNNGHAVNQQPQQPEARRTCPKCGRSFNEDVDFCNCGLSFREEKQKQMRREIERETLERSARMGVTT
jgi:hypothetical protein